MRSARFFSRLRPSFRVCCRPCHHSLQCQASRGLLLSPLLLTSYHISCRLPPYARWAIFHCGRGVLALHARGFLPVGLFQGLHLHQVGGPTTITWQSCSPQSRATAGASSYCASPSPWLRRTARCLASLPITWWVSIATAPSGWYPWRLRYTPSITALSSPLPWTGCLCPLSSTGGVHTLRPSKHSRHVPRGFASPHHVRSRPCHGFQGTKPPGFERMVGLRALSCPEAEELLNNSESKFGHALAFTKRQHIPYKGTRQQMRDRPRGPAKQPSGLGISPHCGSSSMIRSGPPFLSSPALTGSTRSVSKPCGAASRITTLLQTSRRPRVPDAPAVAAFLAIDAAGASLLSPPARQSPRATVSPSLGRDLTSSVGARSMFVRGSRASSSRLRRRLRLLHRPPHRPPARTAPGQPMGVACCEHSPSAGGPWCCLSSWARPSDCPGQHRP